MPGVREVVPGIAAACTRAALVTLLSPTVLDHIAGAAPGGTGGAGIAESLLSGFDLPGSGSLNGWPFLPRARGGGWNGWGYWFWGGLLAGERLVRRRRMPSTAALSTIVTPKATRKPTQGRSSNTLPPRRPAKNA